jgi:hypothetical protein
MNGVAILRLFILLLVILSVALPWTLPNFPILFYLSGIKHFSPFMNMQSLIISVKLSDVPEWPLLRLLLGDQGRWCGYKSFWLRRSKNTLKLRMLNSPELVVFHSHFKCRLILCNTIGDWICSLQSYVMHAKLLDYPEQKHDWLSKRSNQRWSRIKKAKGKGSRLCLVSHWSDSFGSPLPASAVSIHPYKTYHPLWPSQKRCPIPALLCMKSAPPSLSSDRRLCFLSLVFHHRSNHLWCNVVGVSDLDIQYGMSAWRLWLNIDAWKKNLFCHVGFSY